MKPAPFQYHRPESLEAALAMLGDLGEGAKVIAGGQSLVPMLALRLASFDHLIDIGRLDEMRGIVDRGDEVWIGAGVTEATIEHDPLVAEKVPLLARASKLIGHSAIRSRGTVGGSIAHADSAAEFPAVALALDAVLEVASSRGRRTIAAADFFTGLWTTQLADDELLVAVRFPVWHGRCGFAVEEMARSSGDFAIAGVAIAVQADAEDRVARCAIGLIGLGSTPLRARAAESALVGRVVGEVDLRALGRDAVDGLEAVPSDLNGSAAYRCQVAAVMVERAWARAVEEASRGGVGGG
jgi:carbon-monoxide dehydrogenase medium subunit